jgi:flagellar protein FliL
MSAAAATATAPEAPKKKSKKLLFIIIGVVVLALIGAGAALFIMKKNAAAEDGEFADEETEVTHQAKDPKHAPVFLPLENMVVNLADPGGTRFIQLGLTLQLQDAKTEADVKTYMPSIRSDILLLISQRTADEMLQVQGKAKLANDIIAAISKEMGYQLPDHEAEGAEAAPKKKKSKAPPNPVQAVLFSSLIVQ